MPRPRPAWSGGPEGLRDALQRLLGERGGVLLLDSVDAVDEPEKGVYRIDYIFHDLGRGGDVVLEVLVPRDRARVPSIADLVPAALPYEQEIYDLFGIVFEGNPFLREAFFKPEDMKGRYPLRKK